MSEINSETSFLTHLILDDTIINLLKGYDKDTILTRTCQVL